MTEVPIYRDRDPNVVDASELRHFVTILEASQQPDSFGKSVNPAVWDQVWSGWAALYSSGGREAAMASHLVSGVTHVVKIRWSPLVRMRANYRIQYGARYFTVAYVENVKEMNRVLLLSAIEIDSGGS